MTKLAGVFQYLVGNNAITFDRKSALTGFHLLLAVLAGLACNTSALAWLDSAAPLESVEEPQQFSIGPQTVDSGLDQLTSYRADYQLTYDGVRGGQHITGEVIQTVLVTGKSRNFSQVITSSTPGIRRTEYTEIEDQIYIRQDDDRLWFERNVVPELTPGDVGVWSLQKLVLLPGSVSSAPQTATWHGSPVQGFSFGEADLSHPHFLFEQARGELQINPNGDYLVRYSLSGTLEVAIPLSETHLIDRGKISISYTLSQPDGINISIPASENATSGSLASLPRPEDARISVISPALLQYSSVISPISATLFYGTRLGELGWTPILTDVFYEKARLGFEKSQERMAVIVVPDTVTGLRKITLSLEK